MKLFISNQFISNTQFRSQNGHLKSRRYFPLVVQVELMDICNARLNHAILLKGQARGDNIFTVDSLYLDYSLSLTSLCLKLLPLSLESFHQIHLNFLSLYLEPLFLELLSISNKNIGPVAVIFFLSQIFYLHVL